MSLGDDELEGFVLRIGAPRRPHLAEAWRTARDVLRTFVPRNVRTAAAVSDALTSPGALAEVGEVLATRLDGEWLLGDPRRMFLPYGVMAPIEWEPEGVRGRRDEPECLSADPLNAETLVALLAAPRVDVLQAEELALEAARRLASFGVAEPSAVAWVLLDPKWPPLNWDAAFSWPGLVAAWSGNDQPAGSLGRKWRDGAWAEKEDLTERLAAAYQRLRGGVPNSFARSAISDAAWALAWRVLARAGARVRPNNDLSFGYPRFVAGRLDELADANDPLVGIWGLGYAPMDVRGDVVVLGIPTRYPADFNELSAPTWGALAKAQLRRYGPITPSRVRK